MTSDEVMDDAGMTPSDWKARFENALASLSQSQKQVDLLESEIKNLETRIRKYRRASLSHEQQKIKRANLEMLRSDLEQIVVPKMMAIFRKRFTNLDE